MNRKEEEGALQIWQLWPQAVFGLVISVALLLLAALIVVTGAVGEKHIPVLAGLAGFAGALVGAFRAAKRKKTATLLIGLGCGLVMFFAYFLLGVLFSFSVTPSPLTPQMLLAALAGGLTGGFLAGVKPKRKHNR